MGLDDPIELDIWFILVYVVCFVILIMFNVFWGDGRDSNIWL